MLSIATLHEQLYGKVVRFSSMGQITLRFWGEQCKNMALVVSKEKSRKFHGFFWKSLTCELNDITADDDYAEEELKKSD